MHVGGVTQGVPSPLFGLSVLFVCLSVVLFPSHSSRRGVGLVGADEDDDSEFFDGLLCIFLGSCWNFGDTVKFAPWIMRKLSKEQFLGIPRDA